MYTKGQKFAFDILWLIAAFDVFNIVIQITAYVQHGDNLPSVIMAPVWLLIVVISMLSLRTSFRTLNRLNRKR